MKALIIYESIFGNTRDVAEAVAAGLRARPEFAAVELVEVGEAPASLDGVDLLVIGGPVHAWSMTRESTREGAREEAKAMDREPVSKGEGIRDWLDRLPKSEGRTRGAAFDTALHLGWMPSGSAAKPAGRRLRKRGIELVADPIHFFVADKAGPMVEGELERAEAWAEALEITPAS